MPTGHVIPEDHLLPIALGHGPSGQLLDFTYQNRDTAVMVGRRLVLFFITMFVSDLRLDCFTMLSLLQLSELSRVVHTVCSAVPAGVVIFFPSYDYERRVYNHWNQNAFLDKIGAKKKVSNCLTFLFTFSQ